MYKYWRDVGEEKIMGTWGQCVDYYTQVLALFGKKMIMFNLDIYVAAFEHELLFASL